MSAARIGDRNHTIKRLQDGDESAFALLSEEYAPLIDSLVRKFTEGADEDAEDFRQEAVIALYRAAMAFDVSQQNVTFGLYAKICVRNRLISQLRKNKRRRDAEEELFFSAAVFTEDEAVSRKRAEEITGLACSLLTPFELSVFELYAEGADCRVAARKLGRDEKSIENALYRIRVKLKPHL